MGYSVKQAKTGEMYVCGCACPQVRAYLRVDGAVPTGPCQGSISRTKGSHAQPVGRALHFLFIITSKHIINLSVF